MKTKLLNIDANAKTVKGQKHGYLTAVLYLAPYKTAGINVCPFAEQAGCWQTCLNTAGRGGMAKGGATFDANGITLPDNAIQRARIRRTRLWATDPMKFWAELECEIHRFVKKAQRKGLTPVVRLNGTSDIVWEKQKHPLYKKTIFEMFPDLTFYDYTKIPKRLDTELPSNYSLTLSYSAANPKYQSILHNVIARTGAAAVIVARDKDVKQEFLDVGCIDMDEHDLRFLDTPGSLGVLKAKGQARHDETGFVLDKVPNWIAQRLRT